ncbi:MAG: hypothetical protein GXN99_02020, partial [Candidatus Nanohaloarchaeota archaeon]|nr:hypothetical protein [Candidatus Nanohaloarchaeota archaeon]
MKVIAGFNVVQDLIVDVNEEVMALLRKKDPRIVDAILSEKDIEIPLNKEKIEEFIGLLSHFVKERRIGGQAAIASEELSRNNVKVVLYSHYCNPHLIFSYHRPAVKNCLPSLRTNLVLEYHKGEILEGKRISSSNRLILADRSVVTLPYSEIMIEGDLGFFGGFHHIDSKEHFKIVHEKLSNLAGVKRRHVELALNKDKAVAKLMTKHIFSFMHSIGMNKYEMEHYYSINDPYNVEEVGKKVMVGEVKRVHFHDSKHHYVLLKEPSYKEIKNELYGLIKGNEAVYSKAKYGFVKSV